jgi:hypothetical protein
VFEAKVINLCDHDIATPHYTADQPFIFIKNIKKIYDPRALGLATTPNPTVNIYNINNNI